MPRTDTAWTVVHNPATAAQATATKAAPSPAVLRHVVIWVTASIANTVATTSVNHVYLRDGATGAGTIVWSGVLSGAINNSFSLIATGLDIQMTPGNAATLEFDAANITGSIQSVAFGGVTI